MRTLAFVLPLLLLTGCPEGSSTAPSSPPVDPAQQRAAEVEVETRMAEGGAALEVEEQAEPQAAEPLPELRYYAFDG